MKIEWDPKEGWAGYRVEWRGSVRVTRIGIPCLHISFEKFIPRTHYAPLWGGLPDDSIPDPDPTFNVRLLDQERHIMQVRTVRASDAWFRRFQSHGRVTLNRGGHNVDYIVRSWDDWVQGPSGFTFDIVLYNPSLVPARRKVYDSWEGFYAGAATHTRHTDMEGIARSRLRGPDGR